MRTGSILTAAALAASLFGCAHTRPDDMSAEEHEQEALRHQRAAIEESQQYDPNKREIAPGGFLGGPFDNDRPTIYNPTEGHLTAAELHRSHAREHERAAKRLVTMEDAACRGISPEARTACPLLTPYVTEVRELSRGVELRFKDGAPVDALLSRMQCHLAWARTEGYPHEAAEACPLYRKGVQVRRTADRVIELGSQDPAVAVAVQKDAWQLFGAPGSRAAEK